MADMVMMTHPEHGEAGPVTRRAFDTLWTDKGWTLQQETKTTKPRRSSAKTTKEVSS